MESLLPILKAFSRRASLRTLIHVFILILSCVCCFRSAAQDIPIRNPSLEGVTKAGIVPPDWEKTSKSPDIQPGSYGVQLPASEGYTYVGATHGLNWDEGIGQKLSSPLLKDKKYTLSFDLAYPEFYSTAICAGTFAIYGEIKPGDKAELLWASGVFMHKNWKRYSASFVPGGNYNYLSFYGQTVTQCPGKEYTAYLVDNLTPFIYEAPRIELTVRNTCKGVAKGMAAVKISGGIHPHRCSWSNGESGESAEHLRAGSYEVTVTGMNGAVTSQQFEVGETDVVAVAEITPPTCYGHTDGVMSIAVKDGFAPYTFELGNGTIIQDEPIFSFLKAGSYDLRITDVRGCAVGIQRVQVTQPDPLQVTTTITKDVSCDDIHDGKITLEMSGGTLPYAYKMEMDAWQSDSTWRQLDAGRYYYEVKDKNECLIKGSAEIIRNTRQCAVFVPTAFTPNGDGQNDFFRVRIHDDVRDYHFSVYSRWGQPIFETTDPQGRWNGQMKGQPLPSGPYAWVLTYTDSKKQARKQTGSVMLLR